MEGGERVRRKFLYEWIGMKVDRSPYNGGLSDQVCSFHFYTISFLMTHLLLCRERGKLSMIAMSIFLGYCNQS